MYIRMSQYCDKVVVMRSVSVAVEAFDAQGNPLKGVRRSTTEQIAVFNLVEPISHPEIPADEAARFEEWREFQLKRIQKAYIEHAAAGKLGGYPLLKTRSGMGDELARVGEFSGLISTMIEVQPTLIRNVMNGKPQEIKLRADATTADYGNPDFLIERFNELTEGVLRYQHLTGKRGDDLFLIDRLLDIRAAWTASGIFMEDEFAGQGKMKGDRNGRNAASEGRQLFSEMKKRITE
ncbi:hypothetical protein N5C93_23345 [Pseudomonas nitroreducens]|uniref:hypothetical protein n=1 Tax=Pseudomonas nitroreducens TaxID=46680 RepID=UPI001472C7FC|nr:hypothetical protein [Pseudomonas nitroreducens]MDG9856965.1 hypothetical protein [Pseudomonas nitroreducens]MDH1075777.1 hypothetical protein [Pseudomonas nitroreducens]NMZ76677.1 hypothetical protein [Pseudomonas nitroreducens]